MELRREAWPLCQLASWGGACTQVFGSLRPTLVMSLRHHQVAIEMSLLVCAGKGRRGTGEPEERGAAGEILLVVTPIPLPLHRQPGMSAHDLCWPGTVSHLLPIPECSTTRGWGVGSFSPPATSEVGPHFCPPFFVPVLGLSLFYSLFTLLADNSASPQT